MNTDNKISRRDFIKTSALTGGALLASTAIPRRAMEELYKEGRIRAIGVSNFQSDRIINLCYTAEIKPTVNQLELHPFYQREEELAILREYGIVP